MLLHKYTSNFSPLIQGYQLTDEQLAYTGTPDMPIKISLTNTYIHPVLGIENGQLTNFFVLDEKKDVSLYTENKQAILLRTFSTDHRYQRHGYATSVLALLPHFVLEHFPKVDEIVLAVNQTNTGAQALYKKNGFHFMKKTVTSEHGFLLVMSQNLPKSDEQ